MTVFFRDRAEAGQRLAEMLLQFRDKRPVILALPRGGLPIGYEIARALRAPLDVLLVRKIGAPGAPELAAGAVVDGQDPQLVLNDAVIRLYNIPMDYMQQHAQQQLEEIDRRRRLYRAGHPPVDVRDRTAIVVDDGIATGATVRAALKGVRLRKPGKLVLAVPVAPPETISRLENEADEVICLETPEDFAALSQNYASFPQLSDNDVLDILKRAENFPQKTSDNGD